MNVLAENPPVQDWSDWSVTPAKIDEAVRRIIEVANPQKIILFGSRARGDHRPDSDLDLAVIFDNSVASLRKELPYSTFGGIRMEIDLIVASREKFDHYRPWRGNVFHQIDREGTILYDRELQESKHIDAHQIGAGRPGFLAIPTLG